MNLFASLDSEYTKKYGHLTADSDFDEQEDFEPVDTVLMPLEDQDPKLMHDYLTVPDLSYAELVDPGKTIPLLLPYSAVWEAMVLEKDPRCRRYVTISDGALRDLAETVLTGAYAQQFGSHTVLNPIRSLIPLEHPLQSLLLNPLRMGRG